MRHLLFVLTFLALLVPHAAAAQGTPDDLASVPGLQRVIARSWTAPMDAVLAPSTPPAGTSPAASRGTVMLSIFVQEFDTADHAAAQFPTLVDQINTTIRNTAGDAETQPIPLNGIGDQAVAALVPMPIGNQLLYATYGVLQDGPRTYTIAGQYLGMDGVTSMFEIAQRLAAAEPGNTPETYDPTGESTGGLWDVLAQIHPQMLPGSTVADLQIWPTDGTPASDTGDIVLNDMSSPHQLSAINGVTGITGARWDPAPDTATPTSGAHRVEAWHISTSSADTAGFLIFPLADILARDLSITDTVTTEGDNGSIQTTWSAWSSGSGGNPVSMIIVQSDTDLYAVVVTADDPEPIATAIITAMDASKSLPTGKETELRGMEQTLIPAATPAP